MAIAVLCKHASINGYKEMICICLYIYIEPFIDLIILLIFKPSF